MIRNYLITTWRNLIKNKAFSLINILGLSIGISVCFIIMLFVKDELSYDRYNDKADRMYRIIFSASINGGKISESVVMPPVAAALLHDFPEVEQVTRIKTEGSPTVEYNNNTFKEGRIAIVDTNFFSVFTLPFLKGNERTALQQPNTVVLTREMATKYFGNEEPIGKVITINSFPCNVTGIIDKVPDNSHFHFDLFVSLLGVPNATSTTWLESNYFTYLVLRKGYDYKNLEAKFPGMVEKYMGPQIQTAMGMNLEQFRSKGNHLGFRLQPLTYIHLHPETSTEIEAGGDLQYIYIFGAVAVFMLLIACINFVNLSTAGASKRAKEVGVRKVMGSGKAGIVQQFLLESLLITCIALMISFFLVQFSLPLFNELSGKQLSMGFDLERVAGILSLGILVSVLAGIYPAFFLSSFKPIATLKGKLSASTKTYGLRSSLVVFQFFVAVCLIMGTITVYRQMQYIQHKKLGYNKDQVLILSNSWRLGKTEKILRDELLNDPRIANITMSGYRPAGYSDKNNALAYPVGKENETMKTLEYHIDERYIPTLGIEMAEGRNFNPGLVTDSFSMIINETAAKAFGFDDHAIGQRIIRENSHRGTKVPFTVIGVVKDFHFKSLHEAITPLLMVLDPGSGIIIKTKTSDMAPLIASIQQKWASLHSGEPFMYEFLDDLYYKTYTAEQKTGRILNIFAILTIFVACLGLFGLVTYTAEQRSKEIGIRKVLGASVTQVTGMLSKEFIRLVLIACAIAFPLSYWLMGQWLQDFAYRTHISWWSFAIAGVVILLIALITVGFKAIRAALANPVKSLHTE